MLLSPAVWHTLPDTIAVKDKVNFIVLSIYQYTERGDGECGDNSTGFTLIDFFCT